MNLEVKVCGNTHAQNLAEVCDLNPDYVGLIFYKKSKRYVDNPLAVAKLPGCKAKRVGVFVNASKDYIQQTVKEFNLDIIQLHGDETPDFCAKIDEIKPVFKAFQVSNNFNFNSLSSYISVCNKFLFDTSSQHYGGSGKKFNWDTLKAYNFTTPFILSGGISVDDAILIKTIDHSMLSGVDVNSRFESEPGKKDIAKLTTFITTIRKL